jgi:hypothetical protein
LAIESSDLELESEVMGKDDIEVPEPLVLWSELDCHRISV